MSSAAFDACFVPGIAWFSGMARRSAQIAAVPGGSGYSCCPWRVVGRHGGLDRASISSSPSIPASRTWPARSGNPVGCFLAPDWRWLLDRDDSPWTASVPSAAPRDWHRS
jgi:hypothetical protein